MSLKIWAWLQLGNTQNIGVVAPRTTLLKFLEITIGCHPTIFDSSYFFVLKFFSRAVDDDDDDEVDIVTA